VHLNRSSGRPYIAALFVTLSLAIPASAGTHAASTTGTTASAVDVTRVQIDNFGRVDANYYRGGQPVGRDYADLAALGVRTVINLTSDDAVANEQSMVEGAGMKYVNIPMTTHAVPTAAQLAEFIKLVNDPASQPVYVHCIGGRHRTGVMTAVYRMTKDAWTGERAFAEMKQYKFGMDFLHPEFKRFVLAYHADAPAAAPTVVANAALSHAN
jgi:tyrosine-protein phosphatase SIW14